MILLKSIIIIIFLNIHTYFFSVKRKRTKCDKMEYIFLNYIKKKYSLSHAFCSSIPYRFCFPTPPPTAVVVAVADEGKGGGDASPNTKQKGSDERRAGANKKFV